MKTIRIRYVWTRIFFENGGKKVSVFKNIRIRVDGASISVFSLAKSLQLILEFSATYKLIS